MVVMIRIVLTKIQASVGFHASFLVLHPVWSHHQVSLNYSHVVPLSCYE